MDVTQRGQVVYKTITLVSESCCSCGVLFGIPSALKSTLLDNHANFYCPNGHPQHYIGETEAQKLSREKKQVEADLEREKGRALHFKGKYESTERSLTATRGVVTRKKRQLDRVKNGVCPCCNRSFQNLMGHMKKEHPAFQAHE